MKKSKWSRRLGGAVIVSSAALATLAGTQANAASIGVKFYTGRGGAGTPVTGTAGAVPMQNWNNLQNTTTTTALFDSSGAPSGASLTLSGFTGTWTSGVAPDGANGSLLDGYLDVGANSPRTPTIAAITGLTVGRAYDVYVYAQGDGKRSQDDGDGRPNYTVNGTTLYTLIEAPITTSTGGISDETLVAGTTYLTQSVGPGSNATDTGTYGNYIEFPGVVATGGLITVSAGNDITTFRSPLDAIELVPAAVPEPASLGLLGMGALALMKRRHRVA